MKKMILYVSFITWSFAQVIIDVPKLNEIEKESRHIGVLFIGKDSDMATDILPDAVQVPMNVIISQTGENGLNDELPDMEEFQTFLQSAGITQNSDLLLIYGSSRGIILTGRLLLALDAYGFPGKVYVLNGGLPALKKANMNFASNFKNNNDDPVTLSITDVIVDANWVQQHLEDNNVKFVDARPSLMYQGKGKSEGHIPGALNIEFDEVIDPEDEGNYLNANELKEIFTTSGINDGNIIVPYCGTGVWGAKIYLAARQLGYKTHFYDGSFHDWVEKDMPVEKPVKRGLFR